MPNIQQTEWTRGCVQYSPHASTYTHASSIRDGYAPRSPKDRQGTGRTTLCIPRIPNHITHEYIRKVFCKLNAGTITKITDIQLQKESEWKRILMSIDWNQTSTAQYIQSRLFAGHNVKLVYNDPWYWKIILGRKLPPHHHHHPLTEHNARIGRELD